MKRFVFIVIIVVLIIWVWNEKRINPEYITQIDTVYVVKANTTNIRKEPTTKSKIIGKAEKNDTIMGIVTNRWLNINGSDTVGYVFAYNLEQIIIKSKQSVYAGNERQLQIKMFIDKYITLKHWYIWATIVTLFILAVKANVLLHKLEFQIFKWRYNFNKERINWFPYFAGFLFSLLGILSVFYQYKSIIAVSEFSLLPSGKGWVAWFWAINIGLVVFLFLYSTINGFYQYGIVLGLLRLIGELLTATITALFLYLFSVAFAILAILGIILYIVFIGINSKSDFKIPDTTDFFESWRRYEKKQNEFFERQRQINLEFWKRQDKLNN